MWESTRAAIEQYDTVPFDLSGHRSRYAPI